jgi:hypothetical protein
MADTKFLHELEDGDELAPLEFIVTPELNQQYLFAEEDYDRRYLEPNESGAVMVHPALILNMSNETRSPSYRITPRICAVHTLDETAFLNPAWVGKKLRVTWKVLEHYERRGRPYHILDVKVVDEDGVVILTRKMHEILNLRREN